MSVEERTVDAPESWPDIATLRDLGKDGRVVLLPDQITSVNGAVTAAFRDDAQALRVAARRAGLEVTMSMPDGAVASVWREHDATWVVPFVLSIPVGVAANLVANEIQRKLDHLKANRGGLPMPTVRYREVTIEADKARLREIEGPADEVVQLLNAVEEPSGRGDDDAPDT